MSSAAEDGSAPAGTDLTQRLLGDFRLLRRLGKGGMAEVWLAEQTSLKRRVAVKVLRRELLADSDDSALRRFEREARAAAALSHPNIVQVYVVGEADGIHFIAQEYVEGINLREFLKKKGPPELPAALHLMKQIAEALRVAGEAGIVHRDIKPENILIARKLVVKVADFGLAQLTQAGERLELTQVGVTMGTPLYMSPEQFSGEKLDQRSDIYSFGVTCYHLLAGNPPFRAETAVGIAHQHLKSKAPPLAGLRPDLPPALCQIVHKMMAKSPERRYPDAGAVLRDLRKVERVLKAEPQRAAAFTLLELADDPDEDDGRGRLSRWLVRRPLVAFIPAGLLAASVAAAIGWAMRPDNPLETPPSVRWRVPERPDAQEQYQAALLLYPNDEDAWRAVIERFPEDRDVKYRRQAQEQLALLYVRLLRLNEAETLFQDLAALGTGENEVKFKAGGTAGLAVLASLRGRHAESQGIIQRELQPIRMHLDPESEIETYVREAEARNARQAGP